MKKVIIILILGLNLILLNSCAKPTVVNVTLPKDNELNCEKLEDALADAQLFRKKAIGATGANENLPDIGNFLTEVEIS